MAGQLHLPLLMLLLPSSSKDEKNVHSKILIYLLFMYNITIVGWHSHMPHQMSEHRKKGQGEQKFVYIIIDRCGLTREI